MSSTSRDIAGALNFRSGLIPYANDAAANQATEAELRRTIKFPPDKGNGVRAINTAMENGGAGKVLKQSPQAAHFNTTTKDLPKRGPKLNHDQLAMDPPVSEAQRKWAFANRDKGGKEGAAASEFAKADPGGKLPAKAKDGGPGSGQKGHTSGGGGKKQEHLDEAAHAHATAEKAVAKGDHESAKKWMQYAAEHKRLAAQASDEFPEKEEFNEAGTGNKVHKADPDARLKDKENIINVLEKTDPWPSKKQDEKAFGAAAHKTMGRWGGRASDKAGERDY